MAVKEKATLVFEARVSKAEADIRRLRSGVAGVGSAGQQSGGMMFAGYNKAGMALKGVLSVVGLIIKAFKAWIGFIVQSVKAFLKLDKAMREVATISDQVNRNMGKYNALVRSFSTRFAVDASEVARGLYMTISAGVSDATDAQNVLNESLKFGKASLTDMGPSVDLMTTVMNAYGLQADQAGEVSDKLFTAIKLGKTTGPELAGSLGRIIPIAAMAGVSLDDLLASMVQLTKVGISTEEASTALKSTFLGIVAPTQGVTKAVKDMNLQFFNQATLAQEGGIFRTMGELMDATEGDLGEMSTIFENLRALLGGAGMGGDLEGNWETLKEINNSLGATEEAMEILKGGAGFWFDSMSVGWENLKGIVGEGFIAMLGVDNLSAAATAFSDFLALVEQDLNRFKSGQIDAEGLAEGVKSHFKMVLMPAAEKLGEDFWGAFGKISKTALAPVLEAMKEWWGEGGKEKFIAMGETLGAAIMSGMGRSWRSPGEAMDHLGSSIMNWLRDNIPGFSSGFGWAGHQQGGMVGSYAQGGQVHAQGGFYAPASGGSDTVNARLSAGEFVMRREAVDSIGPDVLASLNRLGPATMNINMPNVTDPSSATAVGPRLARGFSRYGRVGSGR